MVTKSATRPISVFQAIQQLTHEPHIDLALSVVLKDLVRLKLKLDEKIDILEKKYGLDFEEFECACNDGRIENPYSYEVEKDNFAADEKTAFIHIRNEKRIFGADNTSKI